MAGPWERYRDQSRQPTQGPWTRYAPQAAAPAKDEWSDFRDGPAQSATTPAAPTDEWWTAAPVVAQASMKPTDPWAAFPDAPANAGTALFREMGNRVKLAARDRAHRELADLFTAPDSVARIRDLATGGTVSPLLPGLARHGAQTATTAAAN